MKLGWSPERLRELLEPTLANVGYEIHDLEVLGESGARVVRLSIDREPAVTIDDCERASRIASTVFDQADPFDSPYTLEVSSPGAERRLRDNRDFQRQLGRLVKVRYQLGDTEAVVQGRLLEVGPEYISLELRGLPPDRIEMAAILHANPVAEL